MNVKSPFQYAILQYVHDAFTEEFLNVGLALYSQVPPFFQVRLLSKYRRVTNTFPDADGEHYRDYITSLQRKFDAKTEAINDGRISFDGWPPARIEEILASVLPADNSSLRFGPTHGGMAHDLGSTFEDLYHRFVESHLPAEKAEGRDEAVIWRNFSQTLKLYNIQQSYFRKEVIQTPRDEVELDHSWRNGHLNGLQPISFDLMYAQNIKKKSHEWFTTNVLVNEAKDIGKIYYLLAQPKTENKSLFAAYIKARDLLASPEYSKKIKVIEENEAEDFAKHIASKIIKDTSHE